MPDGGEYRFVEVGSTGTFTPPPGRKDVLVKNGDGTFDLTMQRSRSIYHFSTDGALVSMTDDYGNTLALTYNGGQLYRITDQAGSGRYLEVGWGPDGRIHTIQDSGGHLVQYDYTPQGGLWHVTDPENRVTTYSYSAGRYGQPRLSQIKDNWNRVVTDVTFDAQDRVHTYTENGETYTYTYNYNNNPNLTSKTDSASNRWVYTVSSGGLISDVTPPSGIGGPRHTDYYPDGLVMQSIDEVGVKTFYAAYNPNGTPTSVTRDYLGTQAVRSDYTYDPAFLDKVTSITPKNPSTGQVNPDWRAWQYEYYQAGDPAPGSLKFVKRVKSDATVETIGTYVYDSNGRITSQTSATGGITDYVYDMPCGAGNLCSVTGPANNDAGTRPVTAYGYDSLGRVTSVTDPLGHATTYTYDGLDRIKTVTLPKPSPGSPLDFTTTYTYDQTESAYPGLVLTYVTDPNGKVTKQGYDQFGRLVKSIDASNNVTTYGYTRDVLTSITDANNNQTTYGYDALRRLRSATFPDSQIEQYDYWPDGLLKTKTDRKNQTITYNYDHLKRVQSKVYTGDGTITYGYTGQKLTTVTDSSVSPETHSFGYDTSYRVQSETQASRGTATHTYNPDDTVATMAVQGGPTTTYGYYPDGSLNTIVWSPVAGQFKYTYRLNDQYASIAFPNSQMRNFSYDDQGRLTQISNLDPASSVIASYAYGYDHDWAAGTDTMLGQRTSMAATVPAQGFAGETTKYYYDPVYQLTRVDYPNVAPLNGEIHQWTYDAIGNRLTNTVNSSTQTYTYQHIGANPLNWQRLLNDGSSAYTYDNNGSAQTRNGPGGNFTFGYDYDNRMTSISGATTASYLYDYRGRRSTKTVGSATTYVYDGLDLVRETGASSADYLFGPDIDEPLAMSRGGQAYYYQTDAIGSVNTITNSSSTVQNSYLYDAWGQIRNQTGALANPFAYMGRETGEAGLNFYSARYYQPSIGRFLSEDLVSITIDSAQRSWYGFAHPIGLFDWPPPPPGIPGGPDWRWSPDKGNSRTGTWIGQNGAQASWHAEEGHWDLKDGRGGSWHYDRRGNFLPGGRKLPPDGNKRWRFGGGRGGGRGRGGSGVARCGGPLGIILAAVEEALDEIYCKKHPCDPECSPLPCA